jgi:hypothetical protein
VSLCSPRPCRSPLGRWSPAAPSGPTRSVRPTSDSAVSGENPSGFACYPPRRRQPPPSGRC